MLDKLFLITVMIMVFAFPVQSDALEASKVTGEELKAMLENPDIAVIDVRTEKEWKKSDQKIKGAVWHDSDEVDQWAEKYPKDKLIVLYCS